MKNCLNCNQPFDLKPKGRAKKYCSSKCREQYRHKANYKPKELKHLKENRKTTLLSCVYCGEMFEAGNSRALYCSRKCYHQIRKSDGRIKMYQFEECIQCKSPFESENTDAKFCSRTCVGKYQSEQAIINNYYSIPRHIFPHRSARREYRRRKRIRDNWVEDVKIEVLIERDKGICQICFESVDLEAHYLHPLAPTNDHITPVSLGGEHSYANCQLAHRKCNTNKNNRIEVNSDGKTEQKRESVTS